MNQSQSSLDLEPTKSDLIAYLEGGGFNAGAARKFDTSEAAIRRFRRRHGVQVPGQTQAYTRIDGDVAEASTPASTQPILDDPDAMLRQRGLDPEQWTITHVTANEYQGPNSAEAVQNGASAKVTYYQTKFTAQKIRPEVQLMAPRADGWKPPHFNIVPHGEGTSQLWVIAGDQQAPWHDHGLHERFLTWLALVRPGRGVLLGDTVDYDNISRYTHNPDTTANINFGNQSAYELLRGYVDASSSTRWQKLYGNHDERLREYILKFAPKLYGLKRVDTPESMGDQVLTMKYLLRLDELDIDLVYQGGGYELSQIMLSEKLAARHGWLVRKGAGASAAATLEHLGFSVITGHTHRQAVMHHTKHEITGKARVLTGVEAGCMCRIEQIPDDRGVIWPDYAPSPDWQQGFVTAEIWPDGFFNIDTAKYVNNTLMWRGDRF